MLVAHTIQQKFCMGIPTNRMERELYSAGLVISRAKLSYWIIRCSEEWLTPIYNRMHEVLMTCEILHMELIAAQYRGRARVLQEHWLKNSSNQSNCLTIVC